METITMDEPTFDPLYRTQRTITASGERLVAFRQFRDPASGRYVARQDVVLYRPGYLLAEDRRIVLPAVKVPELVAAA